MGKLVFCVFTLFIIAHLSESETNADTAFSSDETNNAWEYTCNITNDITGVSWSVLTQYNQSQVLSTCNISSQWCNQTEECSAVATISGLKSLLNISSSFLNNTQVICTEVNDTQETQIHDDVKGHPINWTCDPQPVSESTRELSSTLQANSTLFITTNIRDTSATTSEASITSSKASTATSKEATTDNEILTTPTTTVTKISPASLTSLTTFDQSTQSNSSRDSGGGVTSGVIAGSVAGIVAFVFLIAFVFVIYKRRRSSITFLAVSTDTDDLQELVETGGT